MWTDGVSVRDGRPTQPPGGTKVLPPPLWSPLPGGDPRRSAPPSCPETAPHRSSPSSSPAAPTRTKSRCGRAPPGSSSGPVTQLSLPHIPLMLSGTTPPNPNLNPNWVGDGFQPATFFSTCTFSRRLAAPLPSPLFGPYSHWVQIFPCIFWGCSGHAFHFGGDFFYLHPALVEDPIIPCPSPLVPAAIGPPTGDTSTVTPPTLPSKAPTAPLMGRLKMLGVIV